MGDSGEEGADARPPASDGRPGAGEPAIEPTDRASGPDHPEPEPEPEPESELGSARGPGAGDERTAVVQPADEQRILDPRIRYVWFAGSLVGTLVATAGAGLVALFGLDGAVWPPAAVLVLGAAAGAWLTRARYRRWSYRLRSDSLLLDRGVVTRVRTVVPYVRIQHVDTRRGPIERALGLSSVVVYTAGSRGADVTIPGLTRQRAAELGTRLKRIAIRTEGEDAV